MCHHQVAMRRSSQVSLYWTTRSDSEINTPPVQVSRKSNSCKHLLNQMTSVMWFHGWMRSPVTCYIVTWWRMLTKWTEGQWFTPRPGRSKRPRLCWRSLFRANRNGIETPAWPVSCVLLHVQLCMVAVECSCKSFVYNYFRRSCLDQSNPIYRLWTWRHMSPGSLAWLCQENSPHLTVRSRDFMLNLWIQVFIDLTTISALHIKKN